MADDWPGFGGVRRDGASTEKGLRLEWGDDEPKPLWKTKVGAGYSSVIEAVGLAYTVGNANGKNTIFCFDANSGEKKWTHSFPCEKAPKYFDGGSRATPAVADGILYLASHEGAFFAFEAKTGKVLWSKDLIEDFNGRRPTWGFSGSPLVSDGKVIVDTGSKDGALVAMNAKTGDLVWRGGSDEAGYASPMLRANKPTEILVFNRSGLCSFLLADGRPLYRFQHKTRYGINVAQPLDTGNSILISSAYGKGSALVDVSGRTAKAVWETESFS
ncbi:MAG: PQQ-like beta-propeller repeat protein, partial [Opitutales bacterium]|nr:PQQ-like beta-propeller repeat protein [Opitutales bacterium]